MSFIQDFKAFILRGNVVDLAIAVVIGGAFGKIVNSFVADVLMPPIGMALGKVNFSQLKIILQDGIPAVMQGEQVISPEVPEVAIRYGLFLQSAIDFVVIAFCVFLLIKAIAKMQKAKEEAPAAPPAPTKEEILLEEIRDILKNKS